MPKNKGLELITEKTTAALLAAKRKICNMGLEVGLYSIEKKNGKPSQLISRKNQTTGTSNHLNLGKNKRGEAKQKKTYKVRSTLRITIRCIGMGRCPKIGQISAKCRGYTEEGHRYYM